MAITGTHPGGRGDVASPQSSVDEASVYRKVTWRIVPFLMLCYVVAYLDRVNVGFAKLQMLSDLKFSDTVFGLGAGVFFLGYFLFEVPSNILLHKVGARLWIARIMITWAIISGAFMFVTTPLSFYIMRFLLGLAEAGFFPGIILYLTYWFPAQRRARMVCTFMTAIPVAGLIGGPLSGWIMERFAGVNGYAGWQWLFVLEAVPAVDPRHRRAAVPRRRHPLRQMAQRKREARARGKYRQRGRRPKWAIHRCAPCSPIRACG